MSSAKKTKPNSSSSASAAAAAVTAAPSPSPSPASWMVIPQARAATIYANDPVRTFVGAAACGDITVLKQYLTSGLITDVNATYDGTTAVWSTIYDARHEALVYLTNNRYQRALVHVSNGVAGWTPISYTLHHAWQLATDYHVLKKLCDIDYRPFRDGEKNRPRIRDELLDRYGRPPSHGYDASASNWYQRMIHPTKQYEWSEDQWAPCAYTIAKHMMDTMITPLLTRRLHQLQTLIAAGGGMHMNWKHSNPLGQYIGVMMKPFMDDKTWFVTAIITGWLRYYTNDAITTDMCRLVVDYWPSPAQEPKVYRPYIWGISCDEYDYEW